MLKATMVALLLAVTVIPADAKCTKASLTGNWVQSIGGSGGPASATGGIFDFGGGDTIKVLSLNTTKCTGFVEVLSGGSTVAFGTISTESIASTSLRKPNQVNLNINGGGIYSLLRLYRQ